MSKPFWAFLAEMMEDGPGKSLPQGKAKVRSEPTLHDEPRGVRKTRERGPGYKPGKLFKGHRV